MDKIRHKHVIRKWFRGQGLTPRVVNIRDDKEGWNYSSYSAYDTRGKRVEVVCNFHPIYSDVVLSYDNMEIWRTNASVSDGLFQLGVLMGALDIHGTEFYKEWIQSDLGLFR